MVIHSKIRAFTLVELAIVIVIIGLIVAGVIVGQTLVKQAKLRSITNDMVIYETAYNSFILQYNGVPGDMTNAYDFWGNGGAVCTNASIHTTTGGCNGNGDGKIAAAAYFGDNAVMRKEEFKAWQFLALSGLLPGSYSGERNDAFVIGKNIPPSGYLSTVGVTFLASLDYGRWIDSTTVQGNNVYLNQNNYVFFGTPRASASKVSGPFLTTAEAYLLDNKIDNGLPQNGKFIGYTGQPESGSVTDHCASVTTSSNFYILTHNTIACAIGYRISK